MASLCFLLGVTAMARAQLAPGDAFPALTPGVLTGGTVPPTVGRILLVDFWASWCSPCKASFSALARLNADYASRGLVIVGVSVDEKATAFEAFVAKLKPPFVTLRDRDQKLVRTVTVPVMPTSYLVGRDGRIRFVHQGFHGAMTENELRSHIESLLTEKTASLQ